jgi:hypothetical protein
MMNDMGKRIGAVLASLFLIVCFFAVKSEPVSWNDTSRRGDRIVGRSGTWAIDGSTWVNLTQDKILINGAFYSDKMPLFSVIGAGIYALMHMLGAHLLQLFIGGRFCAYRGSRLRSFRSQPRF